MDKLFSLPWVLSVKIDGKWLPVSSWMFKHDAEAEIVKIKKMLKGKSSHDKVMSQSYAFANATDWSVDNEGMVSR